MTAASIGAAKAGGYARYLEGKTLAPSRGDYYLTPSGEPTQAPGGWLSTAGTLATLGIDGEHVDGADFVALMEGQHPRTGAWVRAAGADGRRGGGIDLTFSAPKSVSTIWALADTRMRDQLEQAHAQAVRRTLAYLIATTPAVRRRREGTVLEEPAADLVAAEYRHTTARGVLGGGPPDPQLHSHVVITSAVRDDGRLVAVASRPLFRAARELGAYYRSALADELAQRGHRIRGGTGRDGRYFEIAGVPDGLLEAFSARTHEVAAAAERFRASYGRAPQRGELRRIKLDNRRTKTPITRVDLQRHWHDAAREHHYHNRASREHGHEPPDERTLQSRVETQLTSRAATFARAELRTVLLEQTVGQLAPQRALTLAQNMVQQGRILALEDGLMTTRAIRVCELEIERQLRRLARANSSTPGHRPLAHAAERAAQRLGAPLSPEQRTALGVITGPARATMLIGPAGTGKGVVIDAAASAEQSIGRQTLGVAVAGSTAQRLARDSPALAGDTLTLDALIARYEHGRLRVNARTTIYVDEAGMSDTVRLSRLTNLAETSGARLVLIGDAAQLPSISAGGMFNRLARSLPSAELREVRRTPDAHERRAWTNLRAGRSDRALAHYRARGRLHLQDSRDEAIEHAVADWARLTRTLPVTQVALISDASNQEIDRLNARAQHHRRARGELGELELPIPGVHYGVRTGDRVTLIEQHRQPGFERVENGERGEIIDITGAGELLVQFDATRRWRTLAGGELGRVRLAYAQHAYRVQGATVTRALVLTGGWQTAKETAYVEASRAREGTDWYLSREELGSDGHDLERIERLAARMRTSRAQIPSLAYQQLEATDELHGRQRARSRSPLSRSPERSR